VKVCICGKGGSGKSTVVSLMAAELRHRGTQVLVIDSDESNTGLYWMLGLDAPPAPLMELAGGKGSIQRTLRTALTEDGDYRQRPVLAREELRVSDLPPAYVQRLPGIALVCIGKIHQALEGCACPMGVLSREFLKKLRLGADEIALVDMEAGVEHFGRGVETSVDVVLAVVEPSLESVGIAERIRHLAGGAEAKFAGAVLNKISDKATGARLKEALQARGISVLAAIPFRQELVLASLEGKALHASAPAGRLAGLLDAIMAEGARAQTT